MNYLFFIFNNKNIKNISIKISKKINKLRYILFLKNRLQNYYNYILLLIIDIFHLKRNYSYHTLTLIFFNSYF